MEEPAIVPDSQSGASSANEYSVEKDNEAQAKALFMLARQRLLDINHWHILSGSESAVFRLTDEKGNEVDRHVRLGDHFKIDILGPGNISGDGFDWVQVEAVQEQAVGNEEIIAIRVRPTSNPTSADEHVAHFFTDAASSTFSVVRKGKIVTASVNGRNEKANLQGNLIDKLRNTIVGTGAILGMNKPQWKSLVYGLLS